jgi:L-fuconate dehydratase
LWAKARGVPLWRLLLDVTPQAVVNLLDLSCLEDVLPREKAAAVCGNNSPAAPNEKKC